MMTGDYHGHPRREMLPFVPADARRVLVADVEDGERVGDDIARSGGGEDLAEVDLRRAGELEHPRVALIDVGWWTTAETSSVFSGAHDEPAVPSPCPKRSVDPFGRANA